MENLHLRKSRDRIRHAVYAFEETAFLQDQMSDIHANVPDRRDSATKRQKIHISAQLPSDSSSGDGYIANSSALGTRLVSQHSLIDVADDDDDVDDDDDGDDDNDDDGDDDDDGEEEEKRRRL
ncbi:hypothetical protein PoB_006650800 [Plakobranchus ocellatus]|uniref:Uncharacterized protein n=1 Tax=Plakobranchus ocellatus TaxID=259542 RepID=A0AAV4D713_9GAST|nr:hypothetical protein PoB_006650800 [Plakobranchus ocellatus]